MLSCYSLFNAYRFLYHINHTISTIPDHSFISSFPNPFPFPFPFQPCKSSSSHGTRIEIGHSLHTANQIEKNKSTIYCKLIRPKPVYHQTLQTTPINKPITNQINPKRAQNQVTKFPYQAPKIKKRRNKNQSRSMRRIMSIWAPKTLLCPSKMLSLTMIRPCGHFNVFATPFRSNIGIIPKCISDRSFTPSWPLERP